MYAAKNLIEKTTSLITELRGLHKLDNKNLDTLQIEILQYIAAHPNLTAYNICKEKVFRNPREGKDIDKRWIGKRISQLAEIGLIERIQKEASQRKKLPCRLTITGLVYLILSREVMYNNTIKGIMEYYSSNALFQLFVHPYINQDTLQRLTSFNSLSPLSLFLYECCRELINDVYRVDASKNKYLTEELFVWHTVPDNKHATNTLREFLKRELNLKWMDCAKFEKIDDGGTLEISYKNDSF